MRRRSHGPKSTTGRLAGAWLLWAATASLHAQNITIATTGAIQGLLQAAGNPTVSMPLWTVRSDAPPAHYERNPLVWTGANVDLSGKAVWNSFTNSFGTTAVSPRHVVYADHVHGVYPPGTIVRFVSAAGLVVERLVVSSARIGATDIDLSTLDFPLPETIHWFKVMPRNWFLSCSRQAPGTLGGMPCIVLDANTQSVAVKDLAAFTPDGFFTANPVDPVRRSFTRELHTGDSGSPMFILVGRELVLDGLYHSAAGGPELSANLALLDAAMDGSGYRMTVAVLSGSVSP